MSGWRIPAALNPGGLGVVAMSYIAVDYLRHLSPTWHERIQPLLWIALALIVVSRVPHYKHWSSEDGAVKYFVASMLFMLTSFLFEVLCVRFSTAVLGLDWHRDTAPLPDTGQWLLLALNEKLPQSLVQVLRARIVGLEHYLMLFMMLAFSVLFDCVEAPGIGLGARYMFTMAIGRLLRAITFVSTILPSARPWCAASRFQVPLHPHRWAQKYYVPYASDANAIRQIIRQDIAYADPGQYLSDYQPDWGRMSFIIDFLRPTPAEGSFSLLKGAEGGCNDLIYSGHMLVSVLTAMAWTEAYGGISSVAIWLLVMHSAQREIRERNHYTVDCIVAIYVGIMLWKLSGTIWPTKKLARLRRLDKIQNRLIQAARDWDMEQVRELLKEMESSSQEGQKTQNIDLRKPCAIISSVLVIVLLVFFFTRSG